ncbi:MAG: Ig-like domain-containing protein [Muribaculaceae bacterium]|nr:Ig-like domain-containing protein [Muribaculaceae bacterium]
MNNKRFIPKAIIAVIAIVALVCSLNIKAQTYTNEPAKAFWPMDNLDGYETPTILTPEGAFSIASFDLNGVNAVGTSGVNWCDHQFIKLQTPNDEWDAVKWFLKPTKGLTFTPTKISAYITKFGTDAVAHNVIVTGKTAEGNSIVLGTYTSARNNRDQADDARGSEEDYAQHFTIELTAEQQAELATTEGFTLEMTVGTNSGKQGGFSQVEIEGVFNGEVYSGTTYNHEATEAFWGMDSMENFEVPSVLSPEGAFTVASLDLNGVSAVGTSGVDWCEHQFIKLQPAIDANDALKWTLKPSKGLTFTPTVINAYIAKFGTDAAPHNVVVTAKTAEGESIVIGTFTSARNNRDQASDKYGSEEDYAQNFSIGLTEDQQQALTTTEGFTLEMTVGTNNQKQGGFSQVKILGFVNGKTEAVAKCPVTIAASPEDAGSVAIRPLADEYDEGTEVTLVATEKFGYDFVNWTDADGNVLSETPEFKYTINRAENLTANFKAVNTYSLTTEVTSGANDYMVSYNPAPTVVDGKNMYEEGTVVTLKASSNPILTFTNWSDGQTSSEISVTMDADKNLTAEYSALDYIVGWDFYRQGANGRPADFAYAENDAATLNLRTADGETSAWLDKSQLGANGYEGRPAAVNWRTTGLGDYYWQTKINASAFKNIKVVTAMVYNYNAYTKQNVEYSLDGENWETLGTVVLEGAKNWADAEFALPAAADNQAELYLRWISDKTSDINGTKSDNDGIALGASFVYGEMELINDGKAPVLISTVPAEGATSASINGKIVLNFDEKVKLAEEATATLGDKTLSGEASGKSVIFTYKNLTFDTAYEFTLPANSIADLTDNYLNAPIKIAFQTRNRPEVAKATPDFIVPDDGDFRAAIAAANSRQDMAKRFRIFVRDGEYMIPMDPDHTVTVNGGTFPDVTLRLTASNTSIIGESMEGTVIINEVPDMDGIGSHPMEGIGNADLLQIQPGVIGTYFQNITLKHGISDNRGRNIVLQDKGDKTIMKDACLWGYQDTYTSNNQNARYYFEGGVLRGRTDFLCGKGDAYYNGVTLQMCASGGYLAVPSVPKQYGYIFKDCEIVGENSTIDGNYTLGRPWGEGTPIALYIDTKMTAKPSAIGWADMGTDGNPARFAEYNSMTASGTVIDLSERKKTFGSGNHPNNPVLTKEEADANDYATVMGGDDDWDPAMDCEQAPAASALSYSAGTLNWDDSKYALCWAVYADGKLLGFTSECSYVPSVNAQEYGIRALNEMGGLGEMVTIGETTGVDTVISGDAVSVRYFNMQGIEVRPGNEPAALIKVTTYGNGQSKAEKVIE